MVRLGEQGVLLGLFVLDEFVSYDSMVVSGVEGGR